MDEAEWMRRYRARFITATGLTEEQLDSQLKADGRPFSELSEMFEDDPEGAADEEMSYWSD